MCKLGLLDFMRQVGTVEVGSQGTLSKATYEKLLNAKGVIKNYIKDTNCKVELYDANSLPADEFVYKDERENIRVKVKDLIYDSEEIKDIINKKDSDEPLLRKIYEFVQSACYQNEKPIDRMKRATNARVKNYFNK